MWKTLTSKINNDLDSANVKKWQIDATHQASYTISMEHNLFANYSASLADHYVMTKRVLIIIDNTVYALYKDLLQSYFKYYDIEIFFEPINGGEDNKNIDLYMHIVNALKKFQPDRRAEALLVIGGGVVTDVGCFVAATYKRGIPVIRIPTTLMGMIDAAIGVKCGINYGDKNLLGAYHFKCDTYIDPAFLNTLPLPHIRNGLAEIIKMGIICSSSLFELCEKNSTLFLNQIYHENVYDIMILAIESMLNELSSNLYEYCLTRAVDFGHTWSPGIELSESPILHGYAVNIDMAFSVCLAHACDKLSKSDVDRIFNLMKAIELPLTHPKMLDREFIMKTLESIKKHRGGQLNLPLPNGIGQCVFLSECTEVMITKAYEIYSTQTEASYA